MKSDSKKEHRYIAKECLLMRVRTLSRVVTSIYEKKLQKYGLKATQLNILVTVANLGSIQQKRLGNYFQMEKSSLSRTLVPMETNGWIRIEKSGVSKRVYITSSGLKVLDKIFIEWKTAQQEVETLIGQQMTYGLKENFKKISAVKSL